MNIRETGGGLLAGVSGLLVVGAFLSTYGDTFANHVGMTRSSDGALAVRVALCPGEEVLSVTVSTSNVTPPATWRVIGPGSTVDTWVVGAPPPDGFVEADHAPDTAFLRDEVTVDVRTTQADDWNATFYVLNVTGGSVLFDGEPTISDDFANIAKKRYPCDDPDGKAGSWKWASRALLLAALLGLSAAALLHPSDRRRALRLASDGTTPLQGWYRNPDNPATVRWWDGTRWTTSVATARPPTVTHHQRVLRRVGGSSMGAAFLANLAPAAFGTRHGTSPEAPWASALHRMSFSVLALGACCLIVGLLPRRRRNR